MEAEKELEMTGRAAIMSTGSHGSTTTAVPRATDDRLLGALRDPPGALGRLRAVRTARWTCPTWRASCGRSSSLYDKGLVYEGERVLPYCWECETPLSNFETRQDDAYRPREDQVVTVSFELDPVSTSRSDDDPVNGPLRLLVWTTTPWTLPSNLALAVGDDIVYSVYDIDGDLRRARRSP